MAMAQRRVKVVPEEICTAESTGGKPPNPPIAVAFDLPFDGDGDDGDEEFPLVHLGQGATAKIMVIDKEFAADALTRLLPNQRPIKPYHVDRIVDDLVHGRWRLNYQPMIKDRSGHLIDGRHRCTAIVKCGIAVPSLVIWGADPDGYPTIDGNVPRSGSDAIRAFLVGGKNSVAIASAALLLYRYEEGSVGATFKKASPSLINEIVARHPGLVFGASYALRARQACRAAGVPVFAYYLFRGISPEQADTFFDQLATGADLQKGNPILAFRRTVQNRNIHSDMTLHLLIKAWNAYRRGENVMVIRPSAEFPEPI